MLKKVIITLIALNVLLFIGGMVFGKGEYVRPPKYEEGVPSITLMPKDNATAVQRGTSSSQNSCYAFGPFETEVTAQVIANKINGFGYWTNISNQETMQTLNFLVYIPPFGSRDEALEVIKEIRKHEIKQHQILNDGPYENAIALGSFNDLNKAQRHAEYVRFLGYDARYTEQQNKKFVYWVNYDEPFGKNIPVLQWAKETDEKSSPQKIPKECIR